MAKKIKYPPSAIRRCDKELKDLLRRIIETKSGGTTIKGAKGPARRLNENTGDLKNKIKPVIKVINSELHIDIEVVKYYQWLDTGSSKIKYPWFLTKEFTTHPQFIKSIEVLTAKGIAFTMKENLKVG